MKLHIGFARKQFPNWLNGLAAAFGRTLVPASVIVVAMLASTDAMAQYLTAEHYSAWPNMSTPQNILNVTMGADGSVYGTNPLDGTHKLGEIFKITSAGTYISLHSFNQGDTAGYSPGGSLTLGQDGNFYGFTTGGGSANNAPVIYKIDTVGNLTIFYSFPNSSQYIPSSVILGIDGNVYGTSNIQGGSSQVFKVTPGGAFTVLHDFTNAADGCGWNLPLVQGRTDGNLYGTTNGCGFAPSSSPFSAGTIYKITPSGTFSLLYTFPSDGSAGQAPATPLLQGVDGNFYGSTAGGTLASKGTIFKVTPSGILTTLYSSLQGGTSPLVQASDGNLYGTQGGNYVFKITPTGTFTNLFNFGNYAPPAPAQINPYLYNAVGSIAVSSDLSKIYGATENGGPAGLGGFYILNLASATTGADVAVSGTATDNPLGRSTFSLTLSNSGPVTATNASVMMSLPKNSTFVSSSGSCTTTTPILNSTFIVCNVGSLAQSVSSPLTITLQTTPAAKISPVFTAFSDESDPVLSNNSITITVIPPPGASIGVTSFADAQISSGLQRTLTITNAGPAVATNSTVTAVLPAGEALVPSASSPSCSQSGQAIKCNVGTIAVNGSTNVVVTISNDLTAPITFKLSTDATDTNSQTAFTDYPPAASISIGFADAQISAGLQRTLTITNSGAGLATNTTVTAILPTGEALVPSASSSSCQQSGQTITCSVGTIAANGSANLVVTISNDLTSPITFTLSTSAIDANDQLTFTDYPPAASPTIAGFADVQISTGLQRTLTIVNGGAGIATNTTVTATLPAGEALVPSASSSSCSQSGQTITCNVGTIAGNNASTSLVVTISNDLTAPITFTLSTTAIDANTQTTFTDYPPLSSITVGFSDVQISTGLQRTLTVANIGNALATNVFVTAPLATGEALIVSGSSSSCHQSGQSISCSVGNIPANGSVNLIVIISNDTTAAVNFTVSESAIDSNPQTTFSDSPPASGGVTANVPALPDWAMIVLGLFLVASMGKLSRGKFR
ncbi:putative repeat protein (TIGR01451 family) [Oxalobacteraceae bacterium GrIS 1.18]